MARSNSVSVDVWQFVRIMVALEKGARRGGRSGSAYATWRDIWKELDGRLEQLGKSDPVAFSDLMMEQQVVLPNASPERLREVVAIARQATDRPLGGRILSWIESQETRGTTVCL